MRTLAGLASAIFLLAAGWCAAADDHGNSPLTAAALQLDGELVSACIETAGDMDYFLFEAIAGRTYRFHTSHPSDEMDSILYLFDRDGSAILAVDDNSAGGINSRIVWACPQSGVYFLMVRHAQATTGTGCYGLSGSVVQLDDHGNSRLSATPLTAGARVDGHLEKAGDIDVFLLQIEPGYDYTLQFSTQSSASEFRASIYANETTEPLVSVSSAGQEEEGSLSLPTATTLYIFVQSTASEGTGAYALTALRGGYADDHANIASEATPMFVQWNELRGRLEVPGDSDWFQWEARKDAVYSFVLAALEGTKGLRAAIRGPDGQLLNESATGVAGLLIELDWKAPESGTYFLEISSTDGIGAYALTISATLELEAVGGFNPSGYSLDIDAKDNVVYLVVGTKGLLIVDVSDPTAPVEIGSHSTNGYAQALALSGTTAYVANRSEGITIIDVSDPSRPQQIGSLDTPGSAQSITLHGNLALIADQRGGLQIARIQSDRTLSTVSSFDTRGYPTAVTVVGDRALIALGDAGLEILDIANESTPLSIGYLDLTGDASDVAVYNDLAYVAAGYRGIRIINLTDPTAPIEIGSIATEGEAVSVVVSGSTLYVAEQTEGLSVYSLLDPGAPKVVARIDTPGEATALSVVNGHVYLADRQEGMLIIQLLP